MRQAGNAMVICEPGAASAAGPEGGSSGSEPPSQQMEADEDFARQLQAKMNAGESRKQYATPRLHLLDTKQ